MTDLARSILRHTFSQPEGILGRLGGRLMARMNAPCAASVIGLLDIERGDRVLEIGFGPGVGIALAATKSDFVAGADPSMTMFAQAHARNAESIGKGRVDLRCAPAEHLPFEDHTFDEVFAVNSMQLWADTQEGLREIRRVLKDGGRLALGFTPRSGQGRDGVAETLAAAGFRNVRLVESEGCFCALAENW